MPATDEDIVRDLLHRYTEHVRPAASIATGVAARQRRHDRRRRVVSVAAAGAAVGTAAGVVAVGPGHSSPLPAARVRPAIRLTADQRVLYRLSSAAAGQSQGQGRYAVMSTEGDDVKDTSVIGSRTGNMWSYQQGSDGSPSGKGFSRHYSPTTAQFAAMPTSLGALRAASSPSGTSRTGRSRPAADEGPAPVPRPLTVTRRRQGLPGGERPALEPARRPGPALGAVQGTRGRAGVTVTTPAHDSLGRQAVEISRADSSGLPGGKPDGISYATYESPATGAVLESTVTYPPGSDIVTPQDPHGTRTVVDTTVYLRVTWAAASRPTRTAADRSAGRPRAAASFAISRRTRPPAGRPAP